jgi:uncharacterized protein (DUF2126 family)
MSIPRTSWEECKAITEGVYEEARQTRLGADKFMIDGATPAPAAAITWWSAAQLRSTARSCDVRTCCASLILHWQRHPSLSYLFSGLFIGPTSQAPRIDEARHDGLYELEIALEQIPAPDAGRRCPGWSTVCCATC